MQLGHVRVVLQLVQQKVRVHVNKKQVREERHPRNRVQSNAIR